MVPAVSTPPDAAGANVALQTSSASLVFPDSAALALAGLEQPRQVPRMAGLHACTAFGSRGITWAALSAQIVAASIARAPAPIEASLLDSVDAARFVSRRSRRQG